MTKINNIILMSDANNFSVKEAINPYYTQNNVDINKATAEHKDIQNLLTEAGVKVITVPSPIDSQDGVYTANWGLVRGNKAILARLPSARKQEEAYAEKILMNLGKQVFHVPDYYKFSGQGDALVCGNLLFCGSKYRSDEEAQRFAADTLGYERVQLETIPLTDSNGQIVINSSSGWPDSYFYDLDMALAIIKAPSDNNKGLIAYCPEAFIPVSRELLSNLENIEKIEVSIDEAKNAFATNLVSTGEIVIMSANAPKLAESLRQYGLKVVTPEITELSKGGGFIRCMTLTID